MSRGASTTSSSGPVADFSTFMPENSGAHLVIGSSSFSRPSSISMRARIEVRGLVMEAMRNIVSRVMGLSAAMSRLPRVLSWTISPLRQIRVTKPDRSPASTTPCRAPGIRLMRFMSMVVLPLGIVPI